MGESKVLEHFLEELVIPINLASDSEVIWPPFPKQFGHPVS